MGTTNVLVVGLAILCDDFATIAVNLDGGVLAYAMESRQASQEIELTAAKCQTQSFVMSTAATIAL
jgi:hypothetical protein